MGMRVCRWARLLPVPLLAGRATPARGAHRREAARRARGEAGHNGERPAPLSEGDHTMNPVIRSVSVVPSTIKPGETATVYVDAVDPDSRIVSGTVEVLDAAGNKST